MYHPGFVIGLVSIGIATTSLRIITNKIWPSILVHWLTDSAWIILFGGCYLALDSGVLDATAYGYFLPGIR
ncbi:MAG: hypothetical protein OHK0017_01400 [Patescibacteria group bacterium]